MSVDGCDRSVSESRRQVLWAFGFAGLGASCGAREATPSLSSDPNGNWSQPTATILACFCAFQAPSICHRLPLVAPARLHKRSILFAQISGEKTDLGALEP